MARMVGLFIFAGCILVFLVLLFWYGLKGEQNADPAIGSNRPYPEGFGPSGAGGDESTYLATVIVSDVEEFRRNADRELTRMRKPEVTARSWMDEPGAMEVAGLSDAPLPPTDAGVPADPPLRPHRHKKHH
jgi:hypothetical protein